MPISPKPKIKSLPKEQLKNLQAQLKKVEAEIENSRRTNIWGRPQSGKSEAERDKLVQEIAQIQEKITQNESLIQDLEKQQNLEKN